MSLPDPTGLQLNLQSAVGTALRIVDGNIPTFADQYPHDATEHGIYPFRQTRHDYPEGSHVGWTTGFWAGMLWLAYDLTNSSQYRAAGEQNVHRFADRLQRKIDVDHHDIGFLYSLSCVAAWLRTQDQFARQTALRAADQLMTRFVPKPGIFQAWSTLDDPKQRGRTIVDSLMNMPLLYWASRESGSPTYTEAAVRHTEQLMKHIVRPDGSTYHTFYFDADSGAPRFGDTHQGHRDESTWSRGQAWAIYGFALGHRWTGDPRFRAVAERCTEVFLQHTPADGVVYWDFDFDDSTDPPEPKDSSASAIAACGLLELDRASDARRIVEALIATCATRDRDSSNALLQHGTQNRNSGAGVDEGNLFGDYFYLEALTRLTLPNWTSYW